MSKSVWMKMSCIVVNYKNMKTPVNYKDGGFTLCSARPIEVHGEREPAVSFDIHLDQIQDRHPMSIIYSSTHYDTITLVDIRETHIVPFTLTDSNDVILFHISIYYYYLLPTTTSSTYCIDAQ